MCFLHGLLGGATYAGDPHQGPLRAVHLVRRQGQHRLEKAHPWITNPELRGVHGDRQAADARGKVIAREGALAALVEAAPGVEGERMRGDHEAALQLGAEFRSHNFIA